MKTRFYFAGVIAVALVLASTADAGKRPNDEVAVLPGQPVEPDRRFAPDTARFLAGMPVDPGSPLQAPRAHSGLAGARRFLRERLRKIDPRQVRQAAPLAGRQSAPVKGIDSGRLLHV